MSKADSKVKKTPRVKVETRDTPSGGVKMGIEIDFYFPGERASVKARSLTEATKKVKGRTL